MPIVCDNAALRTRVKYAMTAVVITVLAVSNFFEFQLKGKYHHFSNQQLFVFRGQTDTSTGNANDSIANKSNFIIKPIIHSMQQENNETLSYISVPGAEEGKVEKHLVQSSQLLVDNNVTVMTDASYNNKSVGSPVSHVVRNKDQEHESSLSDLHQNKSKADHNEIGRRVFPPTIVVEVSGEMCNNIAKLATGKGLQLWAEREYGIRANLVLRKEYPNNLGAVEKVKHCFPTFQNAQFLEGNGPEYNNRTEALLSNKSALYHVSNANVEDIENALLHLNSSMILKTGWNDEQQQRSNNETTILLANHLALVDVWVDKFYDDFREYFAFNDSQCCKIKAEPDETVFHFRNYAKEMPDHFKHLGFEELSPNKTANELFRNLKPGDKLAITSRFVDDPTVQSYVEAFTSRGIVVRVIEGQSGVEDFCFLRSAQKELVGYAESTYAAWAGYLGNATKVRLYSVDSPARRGGSSHFRHRVFSHYNWTNPKLQAKVFFELHQAEDAINPEVVVASKDESSPVSEKPYENIGHLDIAKTEHQSNMTDQPYMRACLIVRDDNKMLAQWIAYHYTVLPLRHVIVGVDVNSTEDPMDVLGRWNGTDLKFQIWQSADFTNDINFSLEPQHQYLQRQSQLYARCMEHLHKHDHQGWVALVDTDEYINLNPLDDFLVDKFPNDTLPMSEFALSAGLPHMTPNETLLDRIVFRKKLRQRLGLESSSMAEGASPSQNSSSLPVITVLDALEEYSSKHGTLPCHSISYRKFSVVVDNFTTLAETICRPKLDSSIWDHMDVSELYSIQYLYHDPPLEFTHNAWAKVLVDLRRIPYDKLRRVEDHRQPHKPLDECADPYMPDVVSFIHMNHYNNPWNEYIVRRGDIQNDVKEEMAKWSSSAHARGHVRCDQMHGWLNEFVKKFGMERAKLMLKA